MKLRALHSAILLPKLNIVHRDELRSVSETNATESLCVSRRRRAPRQTGGDAWSRGKRGGLKFPRHEARSSTGFYHPYHLQRGASDDIRKSSKDFPFASNMRTQLGCKPRPDQVSCGGSGFRNLGWTFGYGRRSADPSEPGFSICLSLCSSFSFSASIFAERIEAISS
jgi:hypothetical protein